MTEDGPKPIEEIEVGDVVLAYNELTGQIEYHPVTDLISHFDIKVVYLTIEGETLVTTADHPFYTSDGEWVEAGDLQVGYDIRTASWETGEVESVTYLVDPQQMYNFTVATAHTYFVGETQWLVHNSGLGSPIGPCGRSLSEIGQTVDWGYGEKGAQDLIDSIDLANERFEDLLTDLLDAGITPDEARWAADH